MISNPFGGQPRAPEFNTNALEGGYNDAERADAEAAATKRSQNAVVRVAQGAGSLAASSFEGIKSNAGWLLGKGADTVNYLRGTKPEPLLPTSQKQSDKANQVPNAPKANDSWA